MIHQLRIYEIFENNKAAFHAQFRDHAIRIMKAHDFDIMAMWESQSAERTEFIYILRWPDEETMADRWSRFRANEEWPTIRNKGIAEHGTLVGEIQNRVLRATEYPPQPWR